MGFLRFLGGLFGGAGARAPQGLVRRLETGGVGGEAALVELERAETFARLRHQFAPPPPGLGRRVTAVVFSARRGRARELAEALRGLELWQLDLLLEALRARGDRDDAALARVARRLVECAEEVDELAGALALLAFLPEKGDVRRLLAAGRLPSLAPFAARALGALGKEDGSAALLELAESGLGIGRALVIQEAASGPAKAWAQEERWLGLCAAIEDPLVRAWAALPLIEGYDWADRVAAAPALGAALAALLESCARGGWNGGPGPGLGRLPGALRAAEALLRTEDVEAAAKVRTAQALLDSHPGPTLPLRELAEKVFAES